jgi:hypothetical protein
MEGFKWGNLSNCAYLFPQGIVSSVGKLIADSSRKIIYLFHFLSELKKERRTHENKEKEFSDKGFNFFSPLWDNSISWISSSRTGIG